MNSDMTRDEVKAIRKKLGLTQEQMAVAMGVRLRTISRWETGVHAVPSTAARLMRLMASMAEAA